MNESTSLGQFLKLWIASEHPGRSLEALARRCKINSKSSLHDVLTGRRKPSLLLLHSLCDGLKIKGPERKFLLKLWESERKDAQVALGDLDALRLKMREKNSRVISRRLPPLDGWDYVYASLGTLGEGATLEEIKNKSGLTQANCERVLQNLAAYGLVTEDRDKGRFLANGLHSIFEQFSIDEKKYLLKKSEAVQKRMAQDFGKKTDTLYRHYFFSISAGKYPELRSRLKALLDEFADESESATGIELAEMFLAFELRR